MCGLKSIHPAIMHDTASAEELAPRADHLLNHRHATRRLNSDTDGKTRKWRESNLVSGMGLPAPLGTMATAQYFSHQQPHVAHATPRTASIQEQCNHVSL